jgi:putative endonuclease
MDRRGRLGEELACAEYVKRGFRIIGRNVRVHGSRQYGELDIIAAKKRELVFAEVKTRKSKAFGAAAEAVHFLKRRRLVRSVKLYLQQRPHYADWDYRIDVVEVYVDKPLPAVIILENVIEDIN